MPEPLITTKEGQPWYLEMPSWLHPLFNLKEQEYNGEEEASLGEASVSLYGSEIAICYAECPGSARRLDANHAEQLGILLITLAGMCRWRENGPERWQKYECDLCCSRVYYGPSPPDGWRKDKAGEYECDWCANRAGRNND
jgi:hypothetical protein